MMYKRLHANKMATKRFWNEDGFAEKEGAVIDRFIYGEFFNIQEIFLYILIAHETKIVFHVSE